MEGGCFRNGLDVVGVRMLICLTRACLWTILIKTVLWTRVLRFARLGFYASMCSSGYGFEIYVPCLLFLGFFGSELGLLSVHVGMSRAIWLNPQGKALGRN